MGLKRREFLQRASMMLAALGISEAAWWQLSDRSYQALAQPTRRKLALLVGINQYPIGNAGFEPLRGCAVDVQLQQELLIHRFGFQASDVLTLVNQQATRQQIEDAFINHLIEQAQPGDVVVFHFSGYGSSIPRLNTTTSSSAVQNSLVPVDGTPPTQETGEINHVLEDTLWLLRQSLATDNVITILDTSYTYPNFDQPATLRIRSSGTPTTSQLSSDELALQDQLLSQLNLTREQLEHRSPRQFRGLVLAAAKPSQVAAEMNWDGLNAGLFTAILTQTLWSAFASDSLQSRFTQVAGCVEQVMGAAQQPQLYQQKVPLEETAKSEQLLSKTFRFNSAAADGIVTAVEDNGKTAKLMLTGVPASVLEDYQVNSLFTILPDSQSTTRLNQPDLIVRSRTGLTAKVALRTGNPGSSEIPQIQVGQQVQEAIRILPQQVNLKVALDPKLTRIERVDATSAFSGISDVSIVANDQPADYVLARVRDTTIAQNPSAPLPSLMAGRYGLFSLGQALLPETVGDGGEAVKVAVQRLVPQLKTRLAQKLLHLSVNERSTLIKAKVTLAKLTPQSQVLITRQTSPGNQTPPPDPVPVENPKAASSTQSASSSSVGMVTVPMGSRVQYQIQNNGNLPIYFIGFYLNTRGQAYILDPTLNSVSESDETQTSVPRQQRVSPGKTLSLPNTNSYDETASTEGLGEIIAGPAGIANSYFILSHQPFTKTLTVLDRELKTTTGNLKFLKLSNPLEMVEAILKDLNKASELGIEKAGVSADDLALEINTWATLNLIYRVV